MAKGGAKATGRGANGNGSIRKVTATRNGKQYVYWQARYTEGYDPGTGKQIQRSITLDMYGHGSERMKDNSAARMQAYIDKTTE